MFPAHAQAVLKEFRKITDLGVSGIVLIHGQGNHTWGARVFLDTGAKNAKPTVYARAPFNTEGAHFISGGVTINKARGHVRAASDSPPKSASTMESHRQCILPKRRISSSPSVNSKV